MSLDLRVYLVTGDGARSASSEAVVSAAVAGGVTMVQLRDKRGGTQARTSAARRLGSMLASSGVPLLVNDDVEAACAAGAAGVHLGPEDTHPARARERLGPDALIGWSIHDPTQLADTEAIDACDYLAASPVWPTSTKLDTTAPLGLDGVTALRAAMPKRLLLVGIGGIDAGNAADLIHAGADGIAVVSAIWSAPDPAAAAQLLRTVVDAALDARG